MFSPLIPSNIVTYYTAQLHDMQLSTSWRSHSRPLAFSRGFFAFRTAEQPCDTLVETSSWHVSDIIVQDSSSLALMVSSSTPFARIHHQITHPAGNLTKTGRCTFALIQETIGNVCPHVGEILVTRKTNVRHPFLFRGHELVNAEYTSPDSTIVLL